MPSDPIELMRASTKLRQPSTSSYSTRPRLCSILLEDSGTRVHERRTSSILFGTGANQKSWEWLHEETRTRKKCRRLIPGTDTHKRRASRAGRSRHSLHQRSERGGERGRTGLGYEVAGLARTLPTERQKLIGPALLEEYSDFAARPGR